jgi:hypothetical protein
MVRGRMLSIMWLLVLYLRLNPSPNSGVLYSATPELLPSASRLDRQHELEGGTEVGIRGCPEPPAVGFHD